MLVAVKAIACELPATLGVPLSRLHVPDIRNEVIGRGLAVDISGTTIWRWLSEDAIRPWTHRSWIFPRDPNFETKAGRVLDLYHRRFDNEPLRPDEYVISTDEKTSIQARIPKHATLPAASGRQPRIEHKYTRGGATNYLAALDVHRAKLFGRCEPHTGIKPFAALVQQVMTSAPYTSARRVFFIADNGSSHRGQASIDRMVKAWPNATLVHLPTHSSWLNQIEIYSSIVQRKVLTPSDFADLDEVPHLLLTFQHRYEQTATPFEWKFTRNDLTVLLQRLDMHEPLPQAA